jgi:putative sigma-54 modulation protein
MKLQMQSVHFTADQKLLAFIQEKADKLDMFYNRIIDGEVVMRLNKNMTGENKIVEVKVRIPGKQLFASSQAESFEKAADLVMEAMKGQLIKTKSRQQRPEA